MNETIPLHKYKNVKPNIAFFIYFSVMFLLYTQTLIQLLIQLFIIGYVIIKKIKDYRIVIKNDSLKNIILFVAWFGGLTLLLFLSIKLWSFHYSPSSRTVLSVFRCFAIGLSIFLYCDNTEKALSVLQSFTLAAAMLSIGCLITTPLNEYFTTSKTSGFGYYIGQGRNNVGAVTATTTITSWYLYRHTRFKYGNYLSVFFGVVTILTGSRGALIQLMISVVLIATMDANIFKMITKIIILVMLGAIIVIIFKNVPILYENIWVRLDAMFTTIASDDVEDLSTLGRQYYKEIAFIMFKKRPILGWGVDGFSNYLRTYPIYKGNYIEAVYSHCNYAELASSLGIVGLLVWYVPTAVVLVKCLKYRKSHPLLDMAWQCLIPVIILDYARIPWSNHPGSYIYFVLFITILTLTNECIAGNKRLKAEEQSSAVTDKEGES